MFERIRSRRVLFQDGDKRVIAPAELHVADGRIARVERLYGASDCTPTRSDPPQRTGTFARPGSGPMAPPSAPGEARLLDVGDCLVTPAFVNAHTHLALAFLRGVDAARFQRNLVEDLYFHFESKLSEGDVRAFSRMGAYESLLSGVGTVWDHYYGGTGVVAPTLQDLGGPDAQGSDAALEATLHIHEAAHYRAGGVFAALGPHATDTVSAALLRRVAALAAQYSLPVHMHLSQSVDELARVEAREGCSPLNFLAREGLLDAAPQLVLAHAIFVPEADLARLDPARHTLVYCPSSQLQFGFPADVQRWSARGLSWAVATDCASSNDSMNLQKELRWCGGAASASVTGSAEYARFLESGSLDDARASFALRSQRVSRDAPQRASESLLARVLDIPGRLHPAFCAGAIEEGALANLIAWDTEHPAFWPARDLLRSLAYGDTTQAMHALIVLGEPIGEVGAVVSSVVQSDAYREARAEAEARLARLLGD
jgi:5-methylthioadenosine/S-adenosylhomocysteine deaminase